MQGVAFACAWSAREKSAADGDFFVVFTEPKFNAFSCTCDSDGGAKFLLAVGLPKSFWIEIFEINRFNFDCFFDFDDRLDDVLVEFLGGRTIE